MVLCPPLPPLPSPPLFWALGPDDMWVRKQHTRLRKCQTLLRFGCEAISPVANPKSDLHDVTLLCMFECGKASSAVRAAVPPTRHYIRKDDEPRLPTGPFSTHQPSTAPAEPWAEPLQQRLGGSRLSDMNRRAALLHTRRPPLIRGRERLTYHPPGTHPPLAYLPSIVSTRTAFDSGCIRDPQSHRACSSGGNR